MRETEPNSKNWNIDAYADAMSSKPRTRVPVPLKEMPLESEPVKPSRTVRSAGRLSVNN